MTTLLYPNRNSVTIVLLIISLMIVGGCGSTDSESESDINGDEPDEDSPINFNSGIITPGGTYSYTFEDQNDVEYYCTIHAPDMQGEITVSNDAEAVDSDTVIMRSLSYEPSSLTIAPNTEVVWINESSVDHTVTSGNPGSDGSGNY